MVDITYGTRVLHRDSIVGFERPLDPVLPAFPIVGTFGADVASHLILEHREGNLALASSVALTSNRGGYVANGYFIYEEPGTGRTKWIIDPFAFFQRALGVETMPVPDVTTLSGRRMWFSHIDGDGWNNVTRVEAHRDKPTISALVVLRELIAPYPDLPVAVGVIGADVDERYGTPEAARQAARELYALPQVEIASHTYTHPYQWSFFENYDRRLEERLIGPDESEWKAVLSDRWRKVVRRLFPGLARKAEIDTQVHRRRSAARVQRFSVRPRPGNPRRHHRRRGPGAGRETGNALSVERAGGSVRGRDRADAAPGTAQSQRRRFPLRRRLSLDQLSLPDLADRGSGAADLRRQRQRLHLHHRRRRPAARLFAPGDHGQRHRKSAPAQADQRLLPHVSRARTPPVSPACAIISIPPGRRC